MARKYATVRNPTPADYLASFEKSAATTTASLKSVTYTITSSAADSVGFGIDGLAALTVPATNNAIADAASLVAAWLLDANYLALVSVPSRVIDNEDGTITVTYADQSNPQPSFVDASTGANSVGEAATGGDLVILSADVANGAALPFIGDGFPFAVTEYTSEELHVRRLMPDFSDWPLLDSSAQDEQAKFIALQDLALGEQLQGAVLIGGWKTLAVQGATPVEFLMLQQLHTSYAASASNNGALFLAKELIARIPDAIMSPEQKQGFTDLINWHTQVKWPRPIDTNPRLPPQVIEETENFTYSVYVPAYIVDASAGDVVVSLPPLADAGVLPYWWTRIVCRPNGNSIFFVPEGQTANQPPEPSGETIDGAAWLEVMTDQTVIPGGGAAEWKNLA